MSDVEMSPDQFDLWLDRARRGGPNDATGAGLRMTALTLFARDAADIGANPRPEFLAELKERLAMTTSPLRVATRSWSDPAPGMTIPASSQTGALFLPAGQLLTRFGALLLVVALFAMVAVQFQQAAGPSGSAGMLQPVVATPGVVTTLANQAVNLSECTMAARSPGTVRSLVGQPASIPPYLPEIDESTPPVQEVVNGTPTTMIQALIDPSAVLADLPAASTEVANGVATTITQATACRLTIDLTNGTERANQTVDDRFFAIYSDDFFRLNAFTAQSDDGEILVPGGFWWPLGPTAWTLDDLRMTPDGRAIALISAATETNAVYNQLLLVLQPIDGSWLISEIAPAGAYPMTGGIPKRQYLEIALRDTISSTVTTSPASDPIFHAGEEILVTVGNLGELTQEFRIADLGVSVMVLPGESVTFSLHAPVGLHVMESYATIDGAPYLRLEQVLRIVDESEPIPLG